MKNSASKPRYSSKRTPVVFTENVGVSSNLWPPKITSPLHVVVPLTNATSFTFVLVVFLFHDRETRRWVLALHYLQQK